MTDQRQYQRVRLQVKGTLQHGDNQIPVIIEDVSLQGLRLSAREADLDILPFDSHEPYHASFLQQQAQPLIELDLEQLYRHSDQRAPRVSMGCKVAHIDVESLASLRRLVELNSGDTAFTEHDLNTLIAAIYSNASSACDS